MTWDDFKEQVTSKLLSLGFNGSVDLDDINFMSAGSSDLEITVDEEGLNIHN